MESFLITKGWYKTDDKLLYTLKWVELKHHIDYKSFREGEQIVNHFPNINLLTTKIGLLESLRSYYRLHRLAMIILIGIYAKTFYAIGIE